MNLFNFFSFLFKADVKFVNYERFYRIHSYGVNSDVYKYLKWLLCDLSIFVDGYSGDVFDLMDSGVLEGVGYKALFPFLRT